uniref:RNA helicase n=1 Tax=Pristionchus pacificus TaxID=54126 RepID=A0A8R1Z5A8_PRIPA
QPINVSVGGNKTFSELGLSSWISDQLKELNITKSTPVQEHCIPKVLEGSDVLGCAKTGTGKTMAFALPILHQLSIDPYGVYALVLTPTRELAFQIGDQFQAVGAPINIKISVIVGGRDQVIQSSELTRRPHVVIATPGRLADHIESHPENITKIFAKLQFLVVDVVVNHSLPQCPKTYVHRVGRSARAGRFGSALSFVTQYDVVLLQAIEKLIGKKIDQLNVNEKKVSKEVTQVLVSKREAEIRLEEEGFGERKETNIRKQLLLQGMNEKAVDEIMDERKARR